MNGTVYLPGDTVNITDVEDNVVCNVFQDPGLSLVCNTSNVNTKCCRSSYGPVGDWLYPNGTIVLGNRANPYGDFTQSSYSQQIRLNRKRADVMSPTGVYTCQVPSLNYTANITLARPGK